jgi:hypothetical protein
LRGSASEGGGSVRVEGVAEHKSVTERKSVIAQKYESARAQECESVRGALTLTRHPRNANPVLFGETKEHPLSRHQERCHHHRQQQLARMREPIDWRTNRRPCSRRH